MTLPEAIAWCESVRVAWAACKADNGTPCRGCMGTAAALDAVAAHLREAQDAVARLRVVAGPVCECGHPLSAHSDSEHPSRQPRGPQEPR